MQEINRVSVQRVLLVHIFRILLPLLSRGWIDMINRVVLLAAENSTIFSCLVQSFMPISAKCGFDLKLELIWNARTVCRWLICICTDIDRAFNRCSIILCQLQSMCVDTFTVNHSRIVQWFYLGTKGNCLFYLYVYCAGHVLCHGMFYARYMLV